MIQRGNAKEQRQKLRRLLLLKYAWEAGSISQLCKMVKLQRGVVYRLFEDEVFKAVVESRIRGEASPLTDDELLELNGDAELSEPVYVPSITEIVRDTLNPYKIGFDTVNALDRPAIADLPVKHKVIAIDPIIYGGHDEEARLIKASSICELVSSGSTTMQACEVFGVNTNTFLQWVNPANTNYIKNIADMYSAAKNNFNMMLDEETWMVAKQSLRYLAEGSTVKLTTKIGRVDKEGKIKTTQIKETEKRFEPNFGAVAKVLTTREASKYGTPEERRALQDADKGENYELRLKTLEELDEEEAELLKLLYGKK